jgi:hypothetical protein
MDIIDKQNNIIGFFIMVILIKLAHNGPHEAAVRNLLVVSFPFLYRLPGL